MSQRGGNRHLVGGRGRKDGRGRGEEEGGEKRREGGGRGRGRK